MKKSTSVPAVLALSLGFAGASFAASVLAPGDSVRAFDSDISPSNSSSPGGEQVSAILDGNSGTKYLNFGGAGSGFIVTPSVGASVAQSFVITTANDAAGRDPATWQLYGTNEAILSGNNSNGLGGENWAFIASGNANLPAARFTAGPVTNFTNANPFTSYKMVFPSLKSDTMMQMADMSLWTGSSATGLNVMTSGSSILGIDQPAFSSSYPGNEAPGKAFDGDLSTKYLNFGKTHAGLIVAPAFGSSVITGLEVWTANDSEERDPSDYVLYGSNDPLSSIDNGFGDGENWVEIAAGNLGLPSARLTSSGIINIPNDTAYSLYKFEVLNVKNAGAANSLQFAEIQLYGVPEPSSAALAAVALTGLARRRRK